MEAGKQIAANATPPVKFLPEKNLHRKVVK